ncbi:MAG: glycosyltransferase family 2 protein [Candidatus Sumerlaeia bacterium]|nr:glycosyltransferase family 2 protein [Candidatus Sumerlaeia bacterium]
MSPAPPPKVSAVVLAYNSARFLPVCLDELARSRGVELEVLVVDNASRDDSAAVAKAHPTAPRVIEPGRNLGCAGGNNVGWRAATHPIIVFVNPDCAVERDTLRLLAEALEADPTVGAAGGKLYYPHSRRIQHAGGILHPNAMAEHPGVNQPDTGQFDADRDVDYVTGALLAMRRADLEALGGMDEDFFPAYYEETDLCWRLRMSGRRVRYVAAAVGYHWESVELGLFSPALVRMSYRSRMIFAVKNLVGGRRLAEFVRFETTWFFGPHARGFRGPVIRSYLAGIGFALRCMARLSRRPAGVRDRLPRKIGPQA